MIRKLLAVLPLVASSVGAYGSEAPMAGFPALTVATDNSSASRRSHERPAASTAEAISKMGDS
jgi:hypothetical protein